MFSESERQGLRQRILDARDRRQVAILISEIRRLCGGTSKLALDVAFCASNVDKIAADIVAQGFGRRVRTFIARSVTLEPLLPFLKVQAALRGLVLDLELGGYGSYADEMLNDAGALSNSRPDLVAIVLDLDDIAGRLPEVCATGRGDAVAQEIETAVDQMAHMIRGLRTHNSASLLVQGFAVPDQTSLGDVGDANLPWSLPQAVGELNNRLASLCRSTPACIFFDVDRVAARHGRTKWTDTRLFLSSRLPIAADAFPVYSAGFTRSAAALFRAPRKVLCTDLDNTLWGGILGEDGPEGIVTGSVFPGNCYWQYQRYLKQIASRGILLAAVSKNNEADVEEAFRLRAADIALTLDDFVARKISWDDKASSLRRLAEELSLGLDSFVFVDDNPVECEAIRRELPEVTVVAAPADEPWRLVDLLVTEPLFDAAVVTEDDFKRTQDYRAQLNRAELETRSTSREDFLTSLHIVCTFLRAADAPLARAVQLLAKTNQFNLTTRRHFESEVQRLTLSGSGLAIAVRVRDRFGDAGVVGLALAEIKNGLCTIDSFLLSCRVIGRGIESALLAEVASRAQSAGAHRIIGEYIPSRKNSLCAKFYSDHGFVRSTSSRHAKPDSILYEFDLTQAALKSPAWLTLEGTEQQYEFTNDTVLTS